MTAYFFLLFTKNKIPSVSIFLILFLFEQTLMKKRLRYAMPHTALIKLKPEVQEPEVQEPEVSGTSHGTARRSTITSSTSRTCTVCYVSIMAKRIAENEAARKRAYTRPAELPLGGDVVSTETGNDVDSDEESNYQISPFI